MATDIDLHLGRRLRRRRRLLGLTQGQLATRMGGICLQQVQKYECGANRISAARLWHLAEALECSVTYFYDGLKDEGGQPLFSQGEQKEILEAFSGLDESARRRLVALAQSSASEHPVPD